MTHCDKGNTNPPVKFGLLFGCDIKFAVFSDSVNWPLRISTFLAGGNCIKEIDLGIKMGLHVGMNIENGW